MDPLPLPLPHLPYLEHTESNADIIEVTDAAKCHTCTYVVQHPNEKWDIAELLGLTAEGVFGGDIQSISTGH